MNKTINRTVLMSGADYFDVVPINPFSHGHGSINRDQAKTDFAAIQAAVAGAGIKVVSTPAPEYCQDGIFTANWGLCRGDTVVLSSLPPQRQAESPFAEAALRDLGKRVIKAPYRFSGQGDALPCGRLLFAGSGYRTDERMHKFLADTLGYEVIGLQAVPLLDTSGLPVTNLLTGWPDSYFYDLDLGISILTPNLIAWCPEAWTPKSQEKIRATTVEKIEVSYDEAVKGFACNLISSGDTVVMSAHAPKLQAAIEAKGLATVTVEAPELAKGGGFIRCTTLTLDND